MVETNDGHADRRSERLAQRASLPSEPDRKIRVTERWQITHNGRMVGNPKQPARRL
jgi:hypothetical protein